MNIYTLVDLFALINFLLGFLICIFSIYLFILFSKIGYSLQDIYLRNRLKKQDKLYEATWK